MKLKIIPLILWIFIATVSCTQSQQTENSIHLAAPVKETIPAAKVAKPVSSSIQVALLLDTSNSMDGLIDQAKAQLWSVVNHLTRLSKEGDNPIIELSLYEYGNDRLTSRTGYVRKVTSLTTELDSVSEGLFALSTLGGQEYCGAAIQQTLTELTWSNDKSNYKVIFIAGNEPFNQGRLPYAEICALAKSKDIFVNTIFCGDHEEGILGNWQKGASLTNGAYLNIDQNEITNYIETPYDDSILSLNDSLNQTYIYYGELGAIKHLNVHTQDINALRYSKSNNVERTISKGSKAYFNGSWDLVDASSDPKFDLNQIDQKTLATKYQHLSKAELWKAIEIERKKRKTVEAQIAHLNKLRSEFIIKKQDLTSAQNTTLNHAMLDIIKKQASTKGYTYN